VVRVLVDQGPYMQARRADGTTAAAATRAEIDRIAARAGEVDLLPARGDLAAAAAALPAGDVRVVATCRPDVGGPGLLVVGRAPEGFNLGIDAVDVRGGRLWFALATDGPAREVRVRAGDKTLEVPTGEGREIALVDSLEILDDDNYDGDDLVRLRPLSLEARNDTGSRLVDAALFRAGIPAHAGPAPELIVTREGGAAVAGTVRGADCVVAGPPFDDLFLDECAWEGARARDGEGPLLYSGRALAQWRDARTLWLGMPVDREWDAHATLAVMVEHAKRMRVGALLAPGEAVVGDAVAAPAPGLVWTRGVDRPWAGTLPAGGARAEGAAALRGALGGAAALVLALVLRAIVRR